MLSRLAFARVADNARNWVTATTAVEILPLYRQRYDGLLMVR